MTNWNGTENRKSERKNESVKWQHPTHNGTTQFISVFCLCVRCACIYRQLWTSTKKNTRKTTRKRWGSLFRMRIGYALASVGARSQHNIILPNRKINLCVCNIFFFSFRFLRQFDPLEQTILIVERCAMVSSNNNNEKISIKLLDLHRFR